MLLPHPTVPIRISPISKADERIATRLCFLLKPSSRTNPRKPIVTLASSGNPRLF